VVAARRDVSRDRIVVLGDVMNDIVVVPRGEIRRDTDTYATIRPRPGGSGANTAAWLGSLGAAVDMVGCVGEEDAAQHCEAFRHAGVVPALQVETGMPTGTIVILVDGQSRTMLTERGANLVLSADAVGDALLADARVLHVSGYAIVKSGGDDTGARVIERARDAGAAISVTPGSAGYVADFGVDRFLEIVQGIDVLFPNLAEGELLTGRREPEAIGEALLETSSIVVLTMGDRGAMLFRRGMPPLAVPAVPVQKFIDPTGAGDAFTAGFLAAWVRDGDAEAATRNAVYVAARAVMLIGGRPPV